jgi:hypothetical protein
MPMLIFLKNPQLCLDLLKESTNSESEAQAEIDSLKKELDKIIMESNKHALLLNLYGKQEFMHALMDSSHIQESYTQFGNIVNKLESMENQPESPVEVASPEHVEQPTMNVDQT